MSKQGEAILVIIQHTILGAGTATVPTPGFETHKHAALTANEISMCVRIGSIYAETKLSSSEIESLLKEAGIAVVSGGALAIVATKLGHAAINELLNFVPVIGWGVKGLLAGSLTASVGWTFLKFCEERWT